MRSTSGPDKLRSCKAKNVVLKKLLVEWRNSDFSSVYVYNATPLQHCDAIKKNQKNSLLMAIYANWVRYKYKGKFPSPISAVSD